MRKIREVLRLSAAGLSARQIAGSVGVARSTVAECLKRAAAAGVSWPLPAGLTEDELERRLYPPAPPRPDAVPLPDWAAIQRELSRKGVTLMLLWQEYKAVHPAGYQYSRFADLHRAWLGTQDAVLRQVHAPGDKLFVDYAGQTVGVVDRTTGEIRQAQIFVAVLGHSSYTYAEATWTQSAADWIGSHVRTLAFIGGAPAAIVPDNLRSARMKNCSPAPKPSARPPPACCRRRCTRARIPSRRYAPAWASCVWPKIFHPTSSKPPAGVRSSSRAPATGRSAR